MYSVATESEIEKTVLPPPLFNYDAYDLLGEWNQWFQKLKAYLVPFYRADSPDEEKIRVLLNHLGNKGKEIYESLEAKDNPGERITSFEELSEALALYFGSIRNVLFERFKFFKMKRRSGLSIVAFAQDLTIAASFCAFTEEDNIIRDKLLEQLKDTGLIERLLVEGGSLTLERAIEICQKWEVRESQANEYRPPNSEDDLEPPNSSATNDSRRKLDSILKTDPEATIKEELDASDSSPVATPAQSHLWLPAKDEPTGSTSDPRAIIKEELDASYSSPATLLAQPHLWLPAEDEPTCSTSDLNLDGEIKMESVDTDTEMKFYSPLVIPSAITVIKTDPHSADDQSKDHNPDGEIKMEPVDEDEEMTFHSPLVIPSAVSQIQTDSDDKQLKGDKSNACGSSDNYRANHRGHLKKHLKIHTGEKPYACETCDYRASQLCHLKEHLRIHTGEKPYACESCDYRASQLSYLRKHLRIHTGEKPFACDSCDYRASRLGYLKQHLLTHTGEKPFVCESCDYRASRFGDLKRHLKTHTGEKPFACDCCDYRASDLSTLRNHSKTHTGEKPYACESCDYRASRLEHLKNHLRTHTGEKPYACNICDYRAREPGQLKKHIRTHTGEKPYACDICDYRASVLGNLKQHMRIHTYR